MASLQDQLPPVWELSGMGFSDPDCYNDCVHSTHEALVLNDKNNPAPRHRNLPSAGTGATSLTSIPGISDHDVRQESGIGLYGMTISLDVYVAQPRNT